MKSRAEGSLAAVRFVAVLSAGLVAGILFGDRMGASFARPALSPSNFVKFQQIQHLRFAKLMPILLGVAILTGVAWLFLVRSRIRTVGLVCLSLAVLAFVSVSVLTRMINVPINNQLMTWSSSSPPSNVMEIWAAWEQAHTVRTLIAVLGFAFELIAFGTSQKVGAA
jgi:uncharacterized membrane protein